MPLAATGDIAVTALGGVFLAYVATVIVLEWLTRDNNAMLDAIYARLRNLPRLAADPQSPPNELRVALM